jgi:uncharacterized protein
VNREERRKLLELARESVRAAASGLKPPGVPSGEPFSGRGGAFVTLKTSSGMLRGCIGHFRGTGSIGETIVSMAAAAATEDPRFPPVTPAEVEGLRLEISILSPMVPATPSEVVPGTHGVYIRSGPYSGTLLPQVASEEGWDREELLAHTCIKAGLRPDAWKSDDRGLEMEIWTYTAEVFGEDKEWSRRE